MKASELPAASCQPGSSRKLEAGSWELPYDTASDSDFFFSACTSTLNRSRGAAFNTLTSGLPVNLTYSPATAFQVSGAPNYRPNITGDPLAPEARHAISEHRWTVGDHEQSLAGS